MTKKRRRFHKEADRVKNELLNTAKELIEKSIPAIAEGINKIVCGFTKSVSETIQGGLTKQIEKKKRKVKPKQEGKQNANT